MSATTTWKCPQCGMDWAVSYRKCPADGYVNMPACVSLVSAKTGKGATLTATARLGKAVFKHRFADDDAQYAADEQFEIVRDTDAAAWYLRPFAGARNPTYYNGAEVPPTGCELSDGGVITIGKSRMQMKVGMK